MRRIAKRASGLGLNVNCMPMRRGWLIDRDAVFALVIALMGPGSVLAPQSGACGSGVRLSRSELAGLLSGLSLEAMHYALAKYSLDEQSIWFLIEDTERLALTLEPPRGNWSNERSMAVLKRLAEVAVVDNLGVKPLSHRKIAQFVGFHHANFGRTWSDRYRELLLYLSGLDGAVQSCFSH